MWPATAGIIKVQRIIVLWCVLLCVIPGQLFGGDVERTSPVPPTPNAAFVLTIHEGLLSLRATEASLKEILDAIGRQMRIEVVTQLPADQRVTLAFDRLSLDAALKRLSRYASIASLTRLDAGEGQGTVTQITVLPKGAGSVRSSPRPEKAGSVTTSERGGPEELTQEEPPRPESFGFSFDPSQFLDRKP